MPTGILWLLKFMSQRVDLGVGYRLTRWPYHWTLRIWSRNLPVGRVIVWNRLGFWWVLRP